MAKTTNSSIDIFKVLDAINKKNKDYFGALTEQQQKEIQPFVLMRWITGANSPWQIIYANEFVNKFAFDLQHHKKLLWFMLTICGPGKFQKYKWIKGVSRKTQSKPLSTGVLKEIYSLSHRQAVEALPIHTVDDIIELAEQLGRQKDEITKIKNEFK